MKRIAFVRIEGLYLGRKLPRERANAVKGAKQFPAQSGIPLSDRSESGREHFAVAIYYPRGFLTSPDPTANIETLAAGLLVLDGLAR